MPWICPSQVRGVLSASFLMVLSQCARSESNLLLSHQSSLRRNLIWNTRSVVCFHILPYTSIYFCDVYRSARWGWYELPIPNWFSFLRRFCCDYWGLCLPCPLHGCGGNHCLCRLAAPRDQKVSSWQGTHSWSRRQQWCQGVRQFSVLDDGWIPCLSATFLQWSDARLLLWWHPCRQCWRNVNYGLKSCFSSRQDKVWQCFPNFLWPLYPHNSGINCTDQIRRDLSPSSAGELHLCCELKK